MARQCEVRGCPARLFSARLCLCHDRLWLESSERYDGDRTKDFAGAYQRWLNRLTGVSALASRRS